MNNIQETDIEKTVENAVDSGTKAVKESTDDWLAYIETHPMQSIFFGAVAFFAIKGLLGSSFK